MKLWVTSLIPYVRQVEVDDKFYLALLHNGKGACRKNQLIEHLKNIMQDDEVFIQAKYDNHDGTEETFYENGEVNYYET